MATPIHRSGLEPRPILPLDDEAPRPAPRAAASTGSSVAPFRAAGWSVLQQPPFEARLLAVLQRLDVRREGAPVVADRLRQALTGALAAPGLDAAAREARTLELLGDMLAAGRGPALVGLRTLMQFTGSQSLPLTPAVIAATAHALHQVEAMATGSAEDALISLSQRAPVPPETVADVARLARLLNQGTDQQRAQAVMKVLLLEPRGPLGALCERARAVILEETSALVRFSPADRGAVVRLMQAWPAASPQRQAELMQAHAGLFTALERALGGGMVGAPPGFAAEQVDRGNPLPTWLSAPASTGLHHDLELIIEAQRLQGRLQRGLR